LLGINSEVITTVGYEVGLTCTEKELQDCASYLRNKAPPNFFEATTTTTTTTTTATATTTTTKFSLDELASFEKTLDNAYLESGEVTAAFAKTFYLGTTLMAADAKRSTWGVYVWCRRTDEIVDAPRTEGEGPTMLEDLSGEW